MMINGISSLDTVRILTDSRKPQQSEKKAVTDIVRGHSGEDKVSLNENQDDVVTYGIPKEAEQPDAEFKSLRGMLAELLEEQGITTQIADEDRTIDFKELTPEEARELVSEEGYLGVEQTSDRIVEFAISLMGDDPARLDEIKESIEQGFQMAKEAMGGTLPEISMKTYDAVMEKLDAWAGSAEESTSDTDGQETSAETE